MLIVAVERAAASGQVFFYFCSTRPRAQQTRKQPNTRHNDTIESIFLLAAAANEARNDHSPPSKART